MNSLAEEALPNILKPNTHLICNELTPETLSKLLSNQKLKNLPRSAADSFFCTSVDPIEIDSYISKMVNDNLIGNQILQATAIALSDKSKSPISCYHFTGKKSFLTIRQALIATPNNSMLMLIDYDKFMNIFPDQEERSQLSRDRHNHNVAAKVIFSSREPLIYGPDEYLPEDYIWVNSKKIEMGLSVFMIGNTVIFLNCDPDSVWGVVVQDPDLAKSTHIIYERLWNVLKS